jgi:ribosome-binding protein aMBF1 (putative translation factor)
MATKPLTSPTAAAHDLDALQPDRRGEQMSTNPNIDSPEVGQRIRALREEKGMSLRGLARRCGIPFYQLWRIETGRRPIKPRALAALARVFGVTTDELIHDVEETPHTPPAA